MRLLSLINPEGNFYKQKKTKGIPMINPIFSQIPTYTNFENPSNELSSSRKEIDSAEKFKPSSLNKNDLDPYDLDLNIQEFQHAPNALTNSGQFCTGTCLTDCRYTCDGGANC